MIGIKKNGEKIMTKLSSKLKIMLGTVLVAVSVMGAAAPAWATPCDKDMTPAECAQQGVDKTNPEGDGGTDLTTTIQYIINAIIFVVGIVAVVMVILGGIQYSTSQGAADKVKKAKDTIMYGIIGLIVAILAFAIVNFVLTSIF